MEPNMSTEWLNEWIQMEKERSQMMASQETYAYPTFIPVHMTGGIGDIVLALDSIYFLAERYKIIVYTKHTEAFSYFCKREIPVFKDMPKFIWHLEFDTIAKFEFSTQFRGFQIKEHNSLFNQHLDTIQQDRYLEHLIRNDYQKYFLLAEYGEEKGWDRRYFPIRCLGFKDIIPFNFRIRMPHEKQITLHDGYDVSTKIYGRATKTWRLDYWDCLVQMLKTTFPDYKIIQLGSVTSRAIEGVDESLLNKTTLSECFDVLSKSSLHIDGDSGLVHAATRMMVPSIVMWGPTPNLFYGYPFNSNLRSKVCEKACYGITESWQFLCPLGYPSPKCMDEITPEQVLDQAKIILKESPT